MWSDHSSYNVLKEKADLFSLSCSCRGSLVQSFGLTVESSFITSITAVNKTIEKWHIDIHMWKRKAFTTDVVHDGVTLHNSNKTRNYNGGMQVPWKLFAKTTRHVLSEYSTAQESMLSTTLPVKNLHHSPGGNWETYNYYCYIRIRQYEWSGYLSRTSQNSFFSSNGGVVYFELIYLYYLSIFPLPGLVQGPPPM